MKHLPSSAPPEIPTACESTHPIPYEITKMIIAHLIHDVPALKACSLTCRSWYIITTPHIHRTLILGRGITHGGLKLLSKLQGLSLIPLVQEIRVERSRQTGDWFAPRAFGRCSLHYFSVFTSVYTLELQRVDIYCFFPHIKHYFRQFSQSLRSIILSELCCTPRQLLHFLSIFPNLDNIKVFGMLTDVPRTTATDAIPIPFSTQKLRGLLALGGFSDIENRVHPIPSCSGLRFRHKECKLYTCPFEGMCRGPGDSMSLCSRLLTK